MASNSALAGGAERYGPGDEAAGLEPGDFVLTHREHLIGKFISVAQKRRFRGPERVFAHWSHCALVVGPEGELVEVDRPGVERSPLAKYRPAEYHVVRLGPEVGPEARRRATAYALARVGQKFGYLAMFSAALWLVFGWRLKLSRADHHICSTLVARALQEAGLIADLDPTFVLPADLARRFAARP